jgi:hypothetical protein
MTVEEILADLGIPAETIAAKKDNIAAWNGKLTTSATESAQKLADAQKALQDAQNLKHVIDEDIAKNGVNESNLAQLRASNAAMSAALAEVKKAGFTGITIPDFPTTNPAPPDPMANLTTLITNGFTTAGQMQDLSARYFRATGKPLPDNPTALADEAAKRRMDLATWGEQKYGLTAIEQKATADRAQKEKDDYAHAKVEEWKAAHPITNGHPELGAGVPSNFPNIPKPSDAKGVREMAGKSPMEKIRMARDRVSAEIKTKMAAA